MDGQWAHWNHQVLPHWDERENKKYLIGKIHQVGFSLVEKKVSVNGSVCERGNPNYNGHMKNYSKPPDDLGTNFYPLLGPYSSKNQSGKIEFRSNLRPL